MDDLLKTLLEAGPAYLLAAVLLWILVSDRKTCREYLRERDAKANDNYDKLYEISMESVRKDTEVLTTLDQVRREIDRKPPTI